MRYVFSALVGAVGLSIAEYASSHITIDTFDTVMLGFIAGVLTMGLCMLIVNRD